PLQPERPVVLEAVAGRLHRRPVYASLGWRSSVRGGWAPARLRRALARGERPLVPAREVRWVGAVVPCGGLFEGSHELRPASRMRWRDRPARRRVASRLCDGPCVEIEL